MSDPEAFIAGIVALFARYPGELHAAAIDPAGGVPARLKTLTSIAAIKAELDDLYEPIARRLRRQAIERGPRALARPPRSPEEQAAIDAQVERWKGAGR